MPNSFALLGTSDLGQGRPNTDLAQGTPRSPTFASRHELKGHAASIEKVAFNPVKDAELCSVSSDRVVRLWDVRTKACVNRLKTSDIHTLAWAPDGQSPGSWEQGACMSVPEGRARELIKPQRVATYTSCRRLNLRRWLRIGRPCLPTR